ncbi:NAD-dependent deacylase [Archangium sp.]|jgi:NAD-dependent deacetylase|uniref:SIR2 family NAD-dependent protein deacylase n=1 Tax=Archangium sp. TaxID=1872627 RepID=UPI002EDABFF4
METLRIDGNTRLLVMTGAGVSAESGIPTFRGSDGLWENHPVEQVASPEGFHADPALVWRFYSQRRTGARPCVPNPGHLAIAEWEQMLGDRFLLATQNVDGLHRLAGNQRLVELHGNLFTTRCTRCERPPFEDRLAYPEGTVPLCGQCGGRLRPNIVWFGEPLDSRDLLQVGDFLRRDDTRLVFMAVGTSGAVWPAAGFVDTARKSGGETWLVNAEPAENTGRFHHFIQGRSGEVLPKLVTFE